MVFTWEQFPRKILLVSIHKISLKIAFLKLLPNLPRVNELIAVLGRFMLFITHIPQGSFTGTGAIILEMSANKMVVKDMLMFSARLWLPQCVNSKHAELLQNVHSHFESYLGFGFTQVDKINFKTTINEHCLSHTAYSMPADVLATSAARASAGMVLIPKTGIFHL